MTSFRKFILPALLAFFLCPSASFGSEIEAYRLGEGLKIPSTPLRAGGYANVVYEDSTPAPGGFPFDDLSFFVFGDIGSRTRFFSEVENEHFMEIPLKGKASTRSNWQIERLYVDYLRGERFNLRVGKFLTPVGTWNEVHADPLTWTVWRAAVRPAARGAERGRVFLFRVSPEQREHKRSDRLQADSHELRRAVSVAPSVGSRGGGAFYLLHRG